MTTDQAALPAGSDEPALPLTVSLQTVPDEQPARVLLVDGEAVQVRLLRGILGPDGYRLPSAGGGAAALTAISEHASDVVVLHLRMPDTDGFVVLEQVRADVWMRRIPVVATTACAERRERLRAVEVGAAPAVSAVSSPVPGRSPDGSQH